MTAPEPRCARFSWATDKGEPIPYEFQNPAQFAGMVLAYNLWRFAEENLNAAREFKDGAPSRAFLRGQADAYEWVAGIIEAMATERHEDVPRDIIYPPKFLVTFREHSPISGYAPRIVPPKEERP